MTIQAPRVLDKDWKINLLLLLGSFGIYFFYFHAVLLHPNSVLSSVTGDALKNYYTYLYQVTSKDLLHFSGMNFPYGEHVVYTDCQPLLTFLLKYLPFTHNYLIGILHDLIFFSFIITPLILNKVCVHLGVERLPAFFISLAIVLLSPQFAKINGGHHGLAYGFAIPLSILLTLDVLQKRGRASILWLFFYNTVIFLIHPYLGFGACLFSFLTLLAATMGAFNKRTFLKQLLQAFLAGIVPVFCFKLFMLASDTHTNRTTEPYGSGALVENIDSILAPDFGPFMKMLGLLFPNKINHFEGHSYLGIFTILMGTTIILIAPFFLKRIRLRKEMVCMLFAAVVLLLFSFGLHIRFLNAIHVPSNALSQFRANCRFAWVFYHVLPLFLFVSLYHTLEKTNLSKSKLFYIILPLLFFSVNLIEAHAYFRKDSGAFWKFRNILHKDFLTPEEQGLIAEIKDKNPQAIIPLPLFMLGSEMFDRPGGDNSMLPSVFLSYHTGIPILSTWLSRTSITETEEIIQMLNSYKKGKKAAELMGNGDFLVIKTSDALLPDEERLSANVTYFYRNDSIEVGTISKKNLLKRKIDNELILLKGNKPPDSSNVVYIRHEGRKPYVTENFRNYGTMFVLDSNRLKTGTYIVSFHFHYRLKKYTSVACDLIVTRGNTNEYVWQDTKAMSIFSGFYDGFAVSEHTIAIQKNSRYEFLVKGTLDENYTISDFMLRPAGKTVMFVTEKGDTIFNNFPPY